MLDRSCWICSLHEKHLFPVRATSAYYVGSKVDQAVSLPLLCLPSRSKSNAEMPISRNSKIRLDILHDYTILGLVLVLPLIIIIVIIIRTPRPPSHQSRVYTATSHCTRAGRSLRLSPPG